MQQALLLVKKNEMLNEERKYALIFLKRNVTAASMQEDAQMQ